MKKKILTFALAATMTVFSTMTAFASGSPVTNPSSNTGNVEDDDNSSNDTQLGDNSDSAANPSGTTNDTEVDSEVGSGVGSEVKADVNDGGIVTAEEVKVIEEAIQLEGTTEKLVVAVVAKDSKDYKVVETATELKDVKYTVIDLKFESGKQPTANTKITLPVAKLAEVKDAKYVSVYRADSETSKLVLVDIAKVDEKGNIAFNPDHFSTYVFAAATEKAYTDYVAASVADTGDTAPIALMITLGAVAAAGCAVVSLKKKNA